MYKYTAVYPAELGQLVVAHATPGLWQLQTTLKRAAPYRHTLYPPMLRVVSVQHILDGLCYAQLLLYGVDMILPRHSSIFQYNYLATGVDCMPGENKQSM